MLFYSPFPSVEAAEKAARALLEQKLVACCNILPAGASLYWWEGAITRATECILLAKTVPALATKASETLAALHPYTCPAILTLPADANAPYAAWVKACLG